MKKNIFLFIMIICLMIQPLFAYDSVLSKDLNEDLLNENHQIVFDVYLNEFQDIYSQDNNQLTILFINQCVYDLQLKELNIQATPVHQNDQFSLKTSRSLSQQTYSVEQYLDPNSIANQELNQFIKDIMISSKEEFLFPFEYVSSYMSLSDIHLHFVFEPIIISGYVFYDLDASGKKNENEMGIQNLKLNFWQGENLIETTLTNQDGYYQFTYQDITPDCYIEAEGLNNYHVTSYVQNQQNNNIFKNENGKIVSSPLHIENTTQYYSLGFVDNQYRIHYMANGGEELFEEAIESYTFKSEVQIASHGNLSRSGYTFQGWNTEKDGQGITYYENTIFQMPNHDLTLFALWKKVPQTSSIPQKKSSSYSLLQVETSDDTRIVVLSLLFLSGLGGMIVMKSLKKKKNR